MDDQEAAEAIEHLGSPAMAYKVSTALKELPDAPGLYSIFIDAPASLPEPFRSILAHRKTRLLYVGGASESLERRLTDHELRHKRPAAFFLAIGVILGYRPARGRFSATDTAEIIKWIDKHLRVEWAQYDAPDIRPLEPRVIKALCPLLNTTHNPNRCQELIDLLARA
jgi:hypothetical protein